MAPRKGIATTVLAALVLAVWVPASAGATTATLQRDAADPGLLQIKVETAAAEDSATIVAVAGTQTTIAPDREALLPPLEWTIAAPDCAQDPGSKVIACSAPVTRLEFTAGDGFDGLYAKKLPFGVIAAMGAGEDVAIGGLADDSIDGGAGADFIKTDKGADTVIGGSEGDDLFGGPGDDAIDAGTGPDRIYGEGGVDVLLTRDGEAERRIDCGPGSDKKERAKVDAKDPRARSC